jgi:rhodanese-related sulfurtransferase
LLKNHNFFLAQALIQSLNYDNINVIIEYQSDGVKMPYKRNLLPKQAFENLTNNTNSLFIDVRSTAEHKFVGFPDNSVLIPWSDEPTWQPNPQEFADAVKKQLSECVDSLDTEIILMCRSGYRSNEALKCLETSGFTHVSHVASGFEGDLDESDQRGNLNGWRHDGMPWTQS